MALIMGEQSSKPNSWRSLAALAAGILLFVLLAMLMVWIGSLFT
jgi:uncharacterized membrane-anchored protein